MSQKGFTMVELLIVIVLVGLFAGLAAFSYSGTSKAYTLISATDQLQQYLKITRAEGISRDTSVEFLAADNGTFVIRRVSDQSVIRNNIILGSKPGDVTVNFSGDLTNSRVVFDNWGKITNTNSTTSTLTVVKGTSSKVVTIESGTGYVH